MNEVEIFSPEAVVVGAFAAFLGFSAFLQLLSFQTDRVHGINARIDAIITTIYEQGRVIPYLLLAAIIAIIAPVYDMYTDAEWIGSIARGTGGDAVPATPKWPDVIQGDPEARTLPHLIHVIQSALALFFMWLYSLIWMLAISRAEKRGKGPTNPLERSAFAGGFGVALGFLSWGLQWMGQHPAFVLRVPL